MSGQSVYLVGCSASNFAGAAVTLDMRILCAAAMERYPRYRGTHVGAAHRMACAKPRRLWRLLGAEALFGPSRRGIGIGSRCLRMAYVPVSGHATASLTPP